MLRHFLLVLVGQQFQMNSKHTAVTPWIHRHSVEKPSGPICTGVVSCSPNGPQERKKQNPQDFILLSSLQSPTNIYTRCPVRAGVLCLSFREKNACSLFWLVLAKLMIWIVIPQINHSAGGSIKYSSEYIGATSAVVTTWRHRWINFRYYWGPKHQF